MVMPKTPDSDGDVSWEFIVNVLRELVVVVTVATGGDMEPTEANVNLKVAKLILSHGGLEGALNQRSALLIIREILTSGVKDVDACLAFRQARGLDPQPGNAQ